MGSFRAYLKFGDIKGEVTKPPYRFWIELKSVREQHGGAGAGEVISCFKDRDSTTPRILQYSADGRAADAVIDMVRESGGVFLRYEMPSAMISRVSYGNESEEISIGCEKIDRKFEPGTPPP